MARKLLLFALNHVRYTALYNKKKVENKQQYYAKNMHIQPFHIWDNIDENNKRINKEWDAGNNDREDRQGESFVFRLKVHSYFINLEFNENDWPEKRRKLLSEYALHDIDYYENVVKNINIQQEFLKELQTNKENKDITNKINNFITTNKKEIITEINMNSQFDSSSYDDSSYGTFDTTSMSNVSNVSSIENDEDLTGKLGLPEKGGNRRRTYKKRIRKNKKRS